MARGTERQLELLVLQELKKAGYPEDSIVTDWRYRNNIFDFVIVDKTTDIPMDYDGIMGVPITFLDKYNPEQFEILGSTQRGCHNKVPDTKKYDDYWEVRQNGEKTGSSGGKTNENPVLVKNDKRKNYFINKEGRIVQSEYTRIFIRRKK